MVGNIGPVIEYEAHSAIISFVGIIIRNEYELRQQCHFFFISSSSRRVGTKKTTEKCAAYSSEPESVLTDE
jgi:hypothetical protein